MVNLSKREFEVAELISLGYSNKQIASKLFLSEHTIKAILENLYLKLGINNRVLLAVYYIKNYCRD